MNIERKIITALITQTEYLRQLEAEWNPEFIESATARLISGWCWEYFKKYRTAPVQDIELIYIKKLKEGLGKELAEEIESEILPGLSNEFERGEINVTYILTQTRQYFKERLLTLHSEALNALLAKHKVDDALIEVQNFKIPAGELDDELDLSSTELLSVIESAFDTTYQNVIKFPGALGDFWNDQLVRGGLVAILASEKKGKTYLLLELMMKAYKQKRKVAFFQAGDMTKNQQVIRICIYLAQKSNLEKYCRLQYIPVQDCVRNQSNSCDKKIRECTFGIANGKPDFERRKTIIQDELIEEYIKNPRYKPCYNCSEWTTHKLGTIWIKEIPAKSPLTSKEAKIRAKRFFIRTKRNIKLATYANGTLTVEKIKATLHKWKEEDFVADVILVDYADLLAYNGQLRDFRHQQNAIWQGLRALSQEEDALVIVPTQADAASYETDRLEMKNFSEDKRKFAHVTAMYGLNQDKTGREKKLGIMRINKIVVREGDFHSSHEVYVLQSLPTGRPFLGSFY
jgi:hypothetical protein